MQLETSRRLTEDEMLPLRSDIMWKYESGMDSIYEDFYATKDRHKVSLDTMCEIIERYCDWDTADGFRQWCNEE